MSCVIHKFFLSAELIFNVTDNYYGIKSVLFWQINCFINFIFIISAWNPTGTQTMINALKHDWLSPIAAFNPCRFAVFTAYCNIRKSAGENLECRCSVLNKLKFKTACLVNCIDHIFQHFKNTLIKRSCFICSSWCAHIYCFYIFFICHNKIPNQ